MRSSIDINQHYCSTKLNRHYSDDTKYYAARTCTVKTTARSANCIDAFRCRIPSAKTTPLSSCTCPHKCTEQVKERASKSDSDQPPTERKTTIHAFGTNNVQASQQRITTPVVVVGMVHAHARRKSTRLCITVFFFGIPSWKNYPYRYVALAFEKPRSFFLYQDQEDQTQAYGSSQLPRFQGLQSSVVPSDLPFMKKKLTINQPTTSKSHQRRIKSSRRTTIRDR